MEHQIHLHYSLACENCEIEFYSCLPADLDELEMAMRAEALNQGWIDINDTDCLCGTCAETYHAPTSLTDFKISNYEAKAKKRLELYDMYSSPTPSIWKRLFGKN